jgi:hypothetical protein
MDIELFMADYPEGLSTDESLVLINGGATSTGAVLLQRGGKCIIISPKAGKELNTTISRINGPKTRVQLERFLTEYSR